MKRLRSERRFDWRAAVVALAGALALGGGASCREQGRNDAAPPSSAAARSASAAPSSNKAPECRAPASLASDADAAAWFPVTAGGHCLDPHADVRRYGGKSGAPLESACATLGVECELPVRLGLSRVVSVRYVDVAGTPERIVVSVWAFSDPEAALAYLTERIDVDMELGRRPTLIDAGAGGVVLGTGAALVRADLVALFELSDERSTPAERAQRAALVLPRLAAIIGKRLPDQARLPRAVELLPPESRRLDVLRYQAFDLFGIAGLGRGARAPSVGHEGGRELVALVRQDEDAADDVMTTLRRVEGARKIKQAPYGAIRLRLTEGAREPMDWVFGRKGTVVLGVGAPVVVVPKKKGMPKPPDKSLLELKALLDRSAGR